MHHTSKANPEIARGNGSLRAAADWEYSCIVRGPGLLEVACTKSKDFDPPPAATYRIHGIDIGHLDEDGQPVTSAVLVPAMTMAAPRSGKAGRGKNQTAAMRALHELSQIARQQMEAQGIDQDDVWVSGAAWRARCIETERIPRQRFAEVAKSLVDAGLVAVNDERVRVGDPEFDRPNE